MSAIILAGGNSKRMNGNKAFLPVYGIKLIERVAANMEPYFEEIIISAHSEKMFEFLSYRVVIDEQPDSGPLMGILSGLRASSRNINFVIACDIPEINLLYIKKMIVYVDKYDIVVPFLEANKYEPLFGFYNKNLILVIEDMLDQKIRKISELFFRCRTKYVPFENNGWYHNLNTMEDYYKYIKVKKRAKIANGKVQNYKNKK